jgi:hypothetical protein
MASITITVNPDVLEKARQKAAARNTTVERLVEESLLTLSEEPNDQLQAVAALEGWAATHPFRVDVGSYSREELNERS